MMRDTILTFTHERFGTVRSVRLRKDSLILAEDLYKALDVDQAMAERFFEDEGVTCRRETLPWVSGQPLEPRRKVALLDGEAAYYIVRLSPSPNARRIGTWIHEVVLPMTEFLSREEMRFGALDIRFHPADAWKYHGPDPSEELLDLLG